MKTPKLLPKSCALTAIVACRELGKHGIKCRPLRVVYAGRPTQYHLVAILEVMGRLRVYDARGTHDLPCHLSFKSSPTQIAKACVKASGDADAYRGQWFCRGGRL